MALASVEVELDHHCERCGAVSSAIVLGHGASGEGDGARRFLADAEAQRDAAAIMRLARCPRCNLRNPSAIRSLWRRGALVLVALAAVGAYVCLLRDEATVLACVRALVFGPLGLIALGAFAVVGYITYRQLRGSDERVRFNPSSPSR